MTPQCISIQDNLSAYQDGDVSPAERALMDAHLQTCQECRDAAQAQLIVPQQLRALRRVQAQAAPPPDLWSNAARRFKAHDTVNVRRTQLRFAMAGACALLVCFSWVWAGVATHHDFPTDAALNDFRQTRARHTKPEFATTDPDAAATWLRTHLHAEIPPLDLSLSHAHLIGADAITLSNQAAGRLLYQSDQGLLAVYIAPRGTDFSEGVQEKKTVDGHDFALADKAKDIGLYGWHKESVGYGLVLPQPLAKRTNFALDAVHATDAPTH